MKGPAECAHKLLGRIMTAPDVPLGKKLLAGFHLLSSSLFVVMLTMALVSVPVLYCRHQYPNPAWLNALDQVSGLFVIASVISLFFWGIGHLRSGQASFTGAGLVNGLRFLVVVSRFFGRYVGSFPA